MIDWQRVTDLCEEIGPEDFDDVVEIFLEETDGAIDQLKEAGDSTSLAEHLHFLKGSALNLGFDDFAKLCSDGEQAAAKGNSDQVDLSLVFGSYAASRAQFMGEYHSKVSG